MPFNSMICLEMQIFFDPFSIGMPNCHCPLSEIQDGHLSSSRDKHRDNRRDLGSSHDRIPRSIHAVPIPWNLVRLKYKTYVWYFATPCSVTGAKTLQPRTAAERSDDRENSRAHRSADQVSGRKNSTPSISLEGTHLHRFRDHRKLGQ